MWVNLFYFALGSCSNVLYCRCKQSSHTYEKFERLKVQRFKVIVLRLKKGRTFGYAWLDYEDDGVMTLCHFEILMLLLVISK